MRRLFRGMTVAVAIALLAGTAGAQGAKPLKKCAPDAVVLGSTCMDKYEASVWRVPNPTTTSKALVSKIQTGKASLLLLLAFGATQLGADDDDDYAPCTDDGQTACADIFAVSLPGVKPSVEITWFQAQQACKNARKRLPTNAEWQDAVAGTPDPGPDNGTTDCHTDSFTLVPRATGSRSACISSAGAFDMVGNVSEWVADWVQRQAGGCGDWSLAVSPTDVQCFAGASTSGEPSALVRGGSLNDADFAGPFNVKATRYVTPSVEDHGFRCAR